MNLGAIRAFLRRRHRAARRPQHLALRWSWTGLLLLAAYSGAGAVGVPINGLRLALPPPSVRLNQPIPSTVHTPVLPVSGTTRPLALVTAIVDESRQPFALADENGAFDLALDVGPLGRHGIRIQVAYTSQDRADELLDVSITRVPDPLPTPQVITVERLTDPNAYVVLLRSTPRTTIIVTGVKVPPAQPRIDDSGRAEIGVNVDPPGGSVTIAATDDQGGESLPTASLDLAALADMPGTLPAFETAERTVSYTISRSGVTRMQSVVVDKHRVEVAEFTRGDIDAATFVREAGGPAGLAPSGSFGCLVSSIRPARPEIEIGDRAKVTLTDDFPELLTAWNGLSDRPRISLCFPDGFPGLGNSGTIQLTVQDYSVVAVAPALSSASFKRLDSGAVQRTYTWDSVPRNGVVDLTLALDAPQAIAALPTVRPRAVIGDEGFGPLLLGLVDALIHGAGIILLLLALSSGAARARLHERPRQTASDIVTIGAALSLLPALGQLDALGVSVASASGAVLEFAGRYGVDPSIVGRWLVGIVGTLVALGVALAARGRLEFVSRVGVAVTGGVGGWLGISFLGWIGSQLVHGITSDTGGTQIGMRLVTWAVGAVGLTAAITVAAGRFALLLQGRQRPLLLRLWPARIGWSVVAALMLAVPAGTESPIPSSPEGAASFVESTVASLAGLMTFAYPLVAVGAVAALVRHVWGKKQWEDILAPAETAVAPAHERPGDDGGRGLVPVVGRALFAGLVIGTGGVLLPVPFLLAFCFFGAILIRPPDQLRRLVRQASRIRHRRPTTLGAALGDARAIEASGLWRPAPASLPGPAELGPEPSIWGNVRLALRVGFVLLLPLLVPYVAQYAFSSVTKQDPYYLQRLGLNVITFAASWLTISVVFGLLYEYLKGSTGMRKGIWMGLVIVVLTVPFQLLSGLATAVSPLGIGIRVFEVLTFTGLLGAAFDLRLLHREGLLQLGKPRQLLSDVGMVSGLPDLAAGIGLLVTALATTVLSLLTGQVTQLLTKALTPFLPVPPTGGP